MSRNDRVNNYHTHKFIIQSKFDLIKSNLLQYYPHINSSKTINNITKGGG